MKIGLQTRKVLFWVVLSFLLLLLFIWIGNVVLISNRGFRSDFYWFWYGGHSLIEHKSPYSEKATREIQLELFERPLESGEYARPFPFPAHFAILFLPFGILPYPTALLLWTGLQFPMLFIALYLIKDFLRLDLHGMGIGFLFLTGSIGFLYPLMSYTMGQLAILMLFLFALAFYLLHVGKPVWAGIALAFIAVRPDMFVIACAAAALIAWKSKDDLKRVVISTAVSLIVMSLIMVFPFGFWFLDWVKIVMNYSAYNPYTHWPLEHISGTGARVALMLAAFVYLVWQSLQFLKQPSKEENLLVISALIIVHQLVVKMTGSYYMTLLLIPSLILLYLYAQYKLQWIMWAMLFSPWALWLLFAGSNPWLPQLLSPLSLFVLQVIYVGLTKSRLTANVARAV